MSGRDHVRGVALLLGLLRQCSDHIIGLVAIALDDRNVECFDDAPDVRDVAADVIRHLLAIGLVLGVLDVPIGRGGRIEYHRDVRRLFALDQIQKGERETESSARVEALTVDAGSLDETEIGTVDQGERIEQEEALIGIGFGHGGKLLRPGRKRIRLTAPATPPR